MNKGKIFGVVFMLVGAFLAFKLKATLIGIGLVLCAGFIHFTFNKIDAFLREGGLRDFFKKK